MKAAAAVAEILKREFAHGVEAELLSTFSEVREVYERVLGRNAI